MAKMKVNITLTREAWDMLGQLGWQRSPANPLPKSRVVEELIWAEVDSLEVEPPAPEGSLDHREKP